MHRCKSQHYRSNVEVLAAGALGSTFFAIFFEIRKSVVIMVSMRSRERSAFRIIRTNPLGFGFIALGSVQVGLALTKPFAPFDFASSEAQEVGCFKSFYYRPVPGDELALPSHFAQRLNRHGELKILFCPVRADCAWRSFDLKKVVGYVQDHGLAISFNESRDDAELSSLYRIPKGILVAEQESVYVKSVPSPIAYPLVVALDRKGRVLEVANP